MFTTLCKQVKNEKVFCITTICSDHGDELENKPFEFLCEEDIIFHNFSCPTTRTPQQNDVVEKKNKYLKEIARIMIHELNVANHF